MDAEKRATLDGPASFLMQEMTFQDYLERVRDGAVVILPCGAVEQHGKYLAGGPHAKFTAPRPDLQQQVVARRDPVLQKTVCLAHQAALPVARRRRGKAARRTYHYPAQIRIVGGVVHPQTAAAGGGSGAEQLAHTAPVGNPFVLSKASFHPTPRAWCAPCVAGV